MGIMNILFPMYQCFTEFQSSEEFESLPKETQVSIVETTLRMKDMIEQMLRQIEKDNGDLFYEMSCLDALTDANARMMSQYGFDEFTSLENIEAEAEEIQMKIDSEERKIENLRSC